MRRLVVLAIGTAVLGWVVSNLLKTDKDKPVSSVVEPPRDDALESNVVPASPDEPANSDEATLPPEEEPASLTDDLPFWQAESLEEPTNVLPLEATDTWESETGDSPTSPPNQNGKARMRRARNGVDQRLRQLPEKGDRRKKDAA